jgi:phosphatidylglycerol lysyltransferase
LSLRIPQTVRRLLPVALSFGIIAVATAVLWRALAQVEPAAVLRHIQSLPLALVLISLLAAATAYTALAIYEVHMLRHVSPAVSARRAFVTALSAYPIGHAIGFGALSGGAVRYRIYTAAGVDTVGLARIVVLSAMPYALGLGVLLALALIVDARQAASLLGLEAATAVGAGVLSLALHAGYIAAVRWRQRPFPVGGRDFSLPPPQLTKLQYSLGLVDVAAAVAALYVLLPESASVSYPAFIAVYVLCILASLASSVPAGLGVFEATLFALLPAVPKDELLAAVLVYRVTYELVPFSLGVLLLLTYEARCRWLAWSARVGG